MKLTATQLRRIIREEVENILEAPRAPAVAEKGKIQPGAVYYGKLKKTPVEINVEVVDGGNVYFTQLMSGNVDEMDMTVPEFEAYLADPKYGFKFSHREEW